MIVGGTLIALLMLAIMGGLAFDLQFGDAA